MKARNNLASWGRLEAHAQSRDGLNLKRLFIEDPKRFERYSVELPSMLLDFSKNLINQEVMQDLLGLATEAGVVEQRNKMLRGDRINVTEDRAVMHTALRDFSGRSIYLDQENISKKISSELKRIENFSQLVRDGQWRGSTGKPITDIVSLGVGGSNLGPKMVTEALAGQTDELIRVHYVSNVDGNNIAETLRPLNPQQVLFVVSSKTFTTTETMTNAGTAAHWLESALFDNQAIAKHFVAVTAAKEKAIEFGIAPQNIFQMWDWVGGRFSLWSAIGLPIALSLGFDVFLELLKGAEEMDQHFIHTPLENNAPVLLALISLWNTTFLNYRAQAILPYDQSLHMFSAYTQQAEMESNGKSVSRDGQSIEYQTVPLIWGQLGIDGQHAFYQYLHQGTNIVPADFIASVESSGLMEHHHKILLANLIAQTQALMNGVDETSIRKSLLLSGKNLEESEQLLPHKVHAGNRPSNTILLKRLNPKSLGALIALYEHKIFVQGVLLDVCSFDQWGVELGKVQAESILDQMITGGIKQDLDSSSSNLIKYCSR